MATTLRLAGMNDLDLALVREAENQAKAVNDAATLRFFPWLSAGAGYNKDTGAAQAFGGKVSSVNQQLYERSVAVNLPLDLGNALFEKFAARQLRTAAAYDSEAQHNDTLFAAAGAYFDLVNAVAAEDIATEAVRISQDYEQQLDRGYRAGLINRSELLRVSVQTQRDGVLLRQAQAATRIASAALATRLRLDPVIGLKPTEHLVAPPTLVPVDVAVQTLVKDALAYRPELRASAASVAAADQERIAAKYGPLIPSLAAQAIYGQIRGGADGYLGDYMSAHEFAIGLNWRLGPGGLFDFSRTEGANSQLRHRRLTDAKLHDDIAQQVVDAYEAARAGLDQMGLARHSVELAEESLKLSEERKEFGVYAVLEVIQAQQDLTQARNDYAQALTQYAKAQYGLARATARIGE
ncbi:MAG TPA: TolC family protein [Steroidobacteraceae bacterium]|nr:TolC family protein [Steroidobacteraceae bacterium]